MLANRRLCVARRRSTRQKRNCPPAFQQPQRPHPTPSCGACPAPAKAVLYRAPPGSEALRRAAAAGGGRGQRRRRRVTAGGGVRPGGRGEKGRLDFLLCCRCCQAPLRMFFFPACFRRCVTWFRSVWQLPVALGPLVSNDLLSVRVQRPVTRFSLRLLTRAGRPVGGDPIYPTACLAGPEIQRAASTSTTAEA
jgi:hypothetical protein